MNEKILQEEKEYWQRQALAGRVELEGVAASLRETIQERDTLRHMVTKMDERLKLINELHREVSLSCAPWTVSHPGNLTADSLRDEIQRAKEYTPQSHTKHARKLKWDDFVPVAKYYNGGINIALSDKDARRVNLLTGEHKLYIFDPKGSDE